MERAQQLGIVMADILATYRQGKRPVTLIGYSLGARAIFVCLQELARRNLLGIVEDAFLIGTPAPSEPNAWNEASKAVAGRFVNAYATNDWFLAFVYRATSVQLKYPKPYYLLLLLMPLVLELLASTLSRLRRWKTLTSLTSCPSTSSCVRACR